MSDCEHMWLPVQSISGCVCQMCGEQRSYSSMLMDPTFGRDPNFEAEVTRRFEAHRDYTGKLLAHKPTVLCARDGCESCIAEGERLDAQLAQHRVSEAA